MEATRDTEMQARIGGVSAQMQKFDFLFGVELGSFNEKIITHSILQMDVQPMKLP